MRTEKKKDNILSEINDDDIVDFVAVKAEVEELEVIIETCMVAQNHASTMIICQETIFDHDLFCFIAKKKTAKEKGSSRKEES